MEDVRGVGRWVENQYNTVCEVGAFLFIFIRLSFIIFYSGLSESFEVDGGVVKVGSQSRDILFKKCCP